MPLQSEPPNVKIVIVGAGSVGVTTAYALLLSNLASEIVLLDIDTTRAEGEVIDLSHAAHYAHAKVRVANGYEDCAGATIVIITAGVNQKPGQTRLDLVKTNYRLFESVVPQVARNAPDTILLVATNPVDVLTQAAQDLSGFPTERIIGSGTAMDVGANQSGFPPVLSFSCCLGSGNSLSTPETIENILKRR
jgi:L-lactate dehydrogenase